jgi:polyisoprenoid-binding protein YceI
MKKLGTFGALVAAALMLLPVSLTAAPAEYGVDAAHSNVDFSVRHLMISRVRGSFDGFKGSFTLDPESGTPSAISGTIDATTVNTANERRDKHLRSDDFFDVENHPTLTFEMTGFKEGQVVGDLTIRGVTRSVSLDYAFGGAVVDAWGNHKAAFTLEGEIDRTDFGLNWNKLLEAGGMTVGDEVRLTVSIQGAQAK